jgi:hypothetical protein
MDSLSDILGNKNFDEPAESKLIKQYIHDNFAATAEVIAREKDIVINVRSAALANTLRLRGPVLKKLIGNDKRLIFRIA